MSKNYIGYINANQTFTNDGIILNDANMIQSIIESQNLVNTTWIFKDSIISEVSQSYNINFESNNQKFITLEIITFENSIQSLIYINQQSQRITVYTNNSWDSNEVYKNIHIIDGNDSTNINLCYWLTENANIQNIKIKDITSYNIANINTNFKYLYDLLVVDKRRINYLDIYRIDHSIGESEEDKIGQYFGQLPPGHSLSIALPFVEFNGVVYRKGDILLKEENGEALRIAAPAGGLFFPQIDVLKHQIKWIYTNNEQVDTQKHYNYIGEVDVLPSSSSISVNDYVFLTENMVESGTENVLYQGNTYYVCVSIADSVVDWQSILQGEDFTTFNYTTIVPTPSEPVRYNKQWNNVSTNITISASEVIVKNSEPILPIVKYYHLNSNQYEEVYCDAYIDASTSDSGSTWILTISSIPSSYVDLVKAY